MIDAHAHLTSPDLFPDLEGIVARAQAAGVEKVVNICTDQDSLAKGIEVKKKINNFYNTAATTPHDVESEGEFFFPLVEEAVAQKELVAIGETGLDYYYAHSKKEVQKKFLSRYFDLATKSGLPLIFHCRDAFADLFAMADGEYAGAAVLHCFTGTLQEARGVLDRGWYLSISGIATFKKSEALRAVVKYVPLDRLLVETDAPYLAPQSKRGQKNEPAYIVETYEMVAALKTISKQELIAQIEKNAYAFFRF